MSSRRQWQTAWQATGGGDLMELFLCSGHQAVHIGLSEGMLSFSLLTW